MCTNRKFRSIMAFLLAVIMVLGMAPSALADGETYGGTDSDGGTIIYTGEPYTGTWLTTVATGSETYQGIRYSLVKINKDAVNTQIDSYDDYVTLGTIDVLSDELEDSIYNTHGSLTSMWLGNTNLLYTKTRVNATTPGDNARVIARRLNALDYEVAYLEDEDAALTTDIRSYSWSTGGTGNGRGIVTRSQFQKMAEAIMDYYYDDTEASAHKTALNSVIGNLLTNFNTSPGSESNSLLKSVGTNGLDVTGEDGRYVYEDTELLNALVMVLSVAFLLDGDGTISWPNTWGPDLDTWIEANILTADDFIAEGDDYIYRILAEPIGGFYRNSVGDLYLGTIRDVAALAAMYDNCDTFGVIGYDESNPSLRGMMSSSILKTMMFIVHQTADEFVDYDKATYTSLFKASDGSQQAKADALGEAISVWETANSTHTSAFVSLGDNASADFATLEGDNYRNRAFSYCMQAMFLNQITNTTYPLVNYGTYALGIISPFNYIRDVEDPGTITIVKEEDGTGKKLEGASFEIYDEDAGTSLGIFTTDSNGEIKLNIADYPALTSGHTYLVTESDPPTGYEKIDTPQEFTIVEDSDGNLSADPSTLTFEDPAAEGEAHLLIDYNMNGFSATVGTSGG